MKNHIVEKIPDYFMNRLDRMQKAEVDAHLQDCSLCREEFDSLSRLWAKLGEIPDEAPRPESRIRFYAMLEAYQEGARHSQHAPGGLWTAINDRIGILWPRQPVWQVGIAAVLLVAGLIGGIRIGAPDNQQTELSNLRDEVQTMGRLLTISLLSQQSASERLRGVGWTSQINQADPQVLSALMKALKYDANVNVRLAAVDALSRFLGDPLVEEEIVGTLPEQQSPLVQIALIDLVVQEQIKQSADVLRKMAADPKVNTTVKKRIEEGMKELSL